MTSKLRWRCRAEVLGVARVGRQDDFFALGHPLAVQLISRVAGAGHRRGLEVLPPALADMGGGGGGAAGGVATDHAGTARPPAATVVCAAAAVVPGAAGRLEHGVPHRVADALEWHVGCSGAAAGTGSAGGSARGVADDVRGDRRGAGASDRAGGDGAVCAGRARPPGGARPGATSAIGHLAGDGADDALCARARGVDSRATGAPHRGRGGARRDDAPHRVGWLVDGRLRARS